MTAGGRRVAGWRSGDCCEDIKKARTSCRGKPGETATQNCLETRRDMGRGLREVGKGFHTQDESFLVPINQLTIEGWRLGNILGLTDGESPALQRASGTRSALQPERLSDVRCVSGRMNQQHEYAYGHTHSDRQTRYRRLCQSVGLDRTKDGWRFSLAISRSRA